MANGFLLWSQTELPRFEVTFILLGTATGVKQLEKQQERSSTWVNQPQKFNPPSMEKHKPPPNPVFLLQCPPPAGRASQPSLSTRALPSCTIPAPPAREAAKVPPAMPLLTPCALHKLNSLFLQLVSKDALQRYGVHRLHRYTTLTSIFFVQQPSRFEPQM